MSRQSLNQHIPVYWYVVPHPPRTPVMPRMFDCTCQRPTCCTLPVVAKRSSPTHNSGSCWAHGAMSSLADRTKIMRKAVWPDINFAIQVILNCGQDIAGTCDGGDPGTMHASGSCHTQSCPWLACLMDE